MCTVNYLDHVLFNLVDAGVTLAIAIVAVVLLVLWNSIRSWPR